MATEGDMTPASIGKRILATLFDVVLFTVLFVAMAKQYGTYVSGNGSFQVELRGLPMLGYMVMVFVYYVITEYVLGATLGKLFVGIRVRSADGQHATVRQVIIRTLLRIVDGFPFLYLVGVIVASSSEQNQRVGDKLADTLVVDRSSVTAT